jgi:hypothetical protein
MIPFKEFMEEDGGDGLAVAPISDTEHLDPMSEKQPS